MRYGWPLVLCALAWVLGCTEPPADGPPQPPISLLTFRYDAARDVVIAHTVSLPTTVPLTAQRYANALASRPDTTYAPAPALRLAHPIPRVTDGTLTVDYRDVAGLDGFSAAHSQGALAALEAWRWTPGIDRVTILAAGEPLLELGPTPVADPFAPGYHTFVVHPETGEVGYLPGTPRPDSLDDALDILRRRDAFTAGAGFEPLLPANARLTADPRQMQDSFLTVQLTGVLPGAEHARLAGIVLMLTQFPQPHAVRFTFNGAVSPEPFMRTALDDIISPYALLLPEEAGTPADAETRVALRETITARMGRAPASTGPARVWRDWAVVPVKLTPQGGTQLFLLQRRDDAYTVVHGGPTLPTGDLLTRQVPRDAIVALRLPGWEQVGLMTMTVASAQPPAPFASAGGYVTELP
jgi:hypothetical protein